MGVVERVLPAAALGYGITATSVSLAYGVPGFVVTAIAVMPVALAALALERVVPERPDYRGADQPLRVELAHYLFDYHLGYGLALGGCALLEWALSRHASWQAWPNAWPLALQIALAGILSEVVSYWQHRLSHRVPLLWRFHSLHHQGERLQLLRAVRFHFVDIGPGAFCSFVPLVLLRAPEAMTVWVASLAGLFGVLEHANVRLRTPRWLAYVVCTPAVHRHHHSKDPVESNSNFGTFTMVFDLLFRTFEAPRPDGPAAVGVDGAPLEGGFWHQIAAPFRAERAPRAS